MFESFTESQPSLLIRADASLQIGTGHVMRMLALAQAWIDRGNNVTLASIECPERLATRLRDEAISFVPLTADVIGEDHDIAATIQLAEKIHARWIVLDGYQFGYEFQRSIRQAGFQLMVIDDYGHSPRWCANIIVNQNLLLAYPEYDNDVKDAKMLTGPKYAMLRREFQESRTRLTDGVGDQSSLRVLPKVAWRQNLDDEGGSVERSRTDFQTPAKRLLVTLGGSDPANVTEQIIELLNRFEGSNLSIRCLIGASNPNRARLASIANLSRHAIEMFDHVDDMPSMYKWADAVISAAGSTCWEWMRYGLPAAVVTIADNQLAIAEALDQRGLAKRLFNSGRNGSESDIEALTEILSDTGRGRGNLIEVKDAWGSCRLASYIDDRLWLRPVGHDDVDLLFQWANEASVRKYSINSNPIEYNGHLRWYAKKQADENTIMLLAVVEDRPVGQIRFDKCSDDKWEISFSVANHARGQGYGTKIVTLALKSSELVNVPCVRAWLKTQNEPSKRVFQRAGFSLIDRETPGMLCFEKKNMRIHKNTTTGQK